MLDIAFFGSKSCCSLFATIGKQQQQEQHLYYSTFDVILVTVNELLFKQVGPKRVVLAVFHISAASKAGVNPLGVGLGLHEKKAHGFFGDFPPEEITKENHHGGTTSCKSRIRAIGIHLLKIDPCLESSNLANETSLHSLGGEVSACFAC